MERWFTPQERGVILFLIAILVLGGAIYVYKLKNPYLLPELKLSGEENVKIEELIYKTLDTLEQKTVSFKRPREKVTSFPININSASKEKLMLLPGIGPSYAQRIIEYREKYGSFKNPEELMKINGIGKKKFKKLKPKITIK